MRRRPGLGGPCAPLLLLLLLLAGPAAPRRAAKWKCKLGCTCTKDTALCAGAKEIPQELPQNLISL